MSDQPDLASRVRALSNSLKGDANAAGIVHNEMKRAGVAPAVDVAWQHGFVIGMNAAIRKLDRLSAALEGAAPTGKD